MTVLHCDCEHFAHGAIEDHDPTDRGATMATHDNHAYGAKIPSGLAHHWVPAVGGVLCGHCIKAGHLAVPVAV